MVAPIRLTPQTQQARRSVRQIAECFEAFGWVVTPPSEDLGEDFIAHIYFNGRSTGVLFHIQAKSITNLQKRKRKDHLPYPFEVKDLLHWSQFALPVILLIWDIQQQEGRWILAKEGIFQLEKKTPNWHTQKAATIRIPWNNTTDDFGLKRLRQAIGQQLTPQLTHGKSIEATIQLKFSNDPHGREALQQFEAYLREGEAVTLTGKFIEKDELLRKLYDIQKRFKRPFQVPKNGFSVDDANAVVGLWNIIKTGKLKTPATNLTLRLDSTSPDFKRFLQVYREQEAQNKLLDFTLSYQEGTYEILGESIDTGAWLRYITCKLTVPYQQLLEQLQQQPAKPLTLSDFTDIEITDIYPDFCLQEAKRLAALVQAKYAVATVYLFGSLARNQGFTPEMDIDLAITGLTDQEFSDLLDYLEQETQFALNVIELEYAPSALQKRILEEGIKLYEAQPVIVGG